MTKPATVLAVTMLTLGIVACVLALKPSSAGAVTRCQKLDTALHQGARHPHVRRAGLRARAAAGYQSRVR